jgi:hypothetical protein
MGRGVTGSRDGEIPRGNVYPTTPFINLISFYFKDFKVIYKVDRFIFLPVPVKLDYSSP